MIFKEYLRDLDDEVRESSLTDGHNAAALVSSLDVLHVCKNFDNEILPLLRKIVAQVDCWILWHEGWLTWDDTVGVIADLNRLVSASIHYGFRFDRYVFDSIIGDPGGYETGGFLAALAKHMRLSGVDRGHDFDQRFKAWWTNWRGRARNRLDWDNFDYQHQDDVGDTGAVVSVRYNGSGGSCDDVEIEIQCDVASMDFRKFDWKPTKLGKYEGWA